MKHMKETHTDREDMDVAYCELQEWEVLTHQQTRDDTSALSLYKHIIDAQMRSILRVAFFQKFIAKSR
jgi:hypothetical protein